jgi:4-hydroxy-2-oxoheptanedioate aldolase
VRQRINLIKQRLDGGDAALGVAAQMNSPETVEAVGAAGFDFAYIDCEHGSFYLEGATNMIRAAEAVGLTPIVRVPNHDPSYIMRVLDAGAMGVIVPNVCTKAQAEAVVAAAKYRDGDNGGTRGACPGTRATWHQTTEWPEFVRWSNDNTLVWPLIESPQAIDNIEEIASVAGIHALMLGPFDYAHAVGLPGQPQHPDVQARYASVLKTARAHRLEVVASLFSATPERMEEEKREWIKGGARILVAGSDRRMLFNALSQRLKALRTRST